MTRRRVVTAARAIRAVSRFRKLAKGTGKYIVLSSMPKSGSTFMAKALATLTGYEHTYFAFVYGNVEQELYLPKVVDAFGSGTVVQQHFKANPGNLQILNSYGIRPMVLVRSLPDLMVSARDHLLKENLNNLPGLQVHPEFPAFSPERQLDFVVDMFAPWYIGYFVSWTRAHLEQKVPVHWIRYETISRDWPGGILEAAKYLGLECTAEDVSRALATVEAAPASSRRLNVGVAGRGKQQLSEPQIERLRTLAGYYPGVDFSPIGLASRAV